MLNYDILEESLEFFDENVGDYMPTYTRKQMITSVPVLIGARSSSYGAGIGNPVIRNTIDLKDSSLLLGGAALFVGGGAYLINKYKNSYLRYSRIVLKLKLKKRSR